jgi:hypothetical protein
VTTPRGSRRASDGQGYRPPGSGRARTRVDARDRLGCGVHDLPGHEGWWQPRARCCGLGGTVRLVTWSEPSTPTTCGPSSAGLSCQPTR